MTALQWILLIWRAGVPLYKIHQKMLSIEYSRYRYFLPRLDNDSVCSIHHTQDCRVSRAGVVKIKYEDRIVQPPSLKDAQAPPETYQKPTIPETSANLPVKVLLTVVSRGRSAF